MSNKQAGKVAAQIAKYQLRQSSMVVIDHNEWRHKSVVNRLIGSIFTKFNLFNLNAAFVNFKIKDFPENVRNDYNTTYKLIESKANNQALIPYLSLPLYNIYKDYHKKQQQLPWNLQKNCTHTKIVQARSKGTKKIFLSDFYQVTFEFEYENKIKQYHVVQRSNDDPNWKFLAFDI